MLAELGISTTGTDVPPPLAVVITHRLLSNLDLPGSPLPASSSATTTARRPREQASAARGSDFATLARRIRDAQLLDRRPLAYALRGAATLLFYAAAWVAVVLIGDSWWQAVAAVVLGVAFTQVAFLGHDAGHQQIFAGRRANDLVGRVLADLLVGLSYGWWVGKHSRHHANPNKEDHDPDIGGRVFAFTTNQIATKGGGLGRMVARRQAWLFFPVLTLEGLHLHVAGLLSLRRGSERSSRGGTRRSEALLMAVHAAAYFTVVLLVMSPLTALVFVAIQQGVWGLYMGCSFAPNHKGMPIIGADEEIDYLRRQVLTSRNIRGGWFTDTLLGGLNYQIEHHLFPNMPRASLRRATHIVRDFCAELDVSYCETSLVGSYRAALGHLDDLGAPLRDEDGAAGS
jgi:fatty acid desaturase